MMEDEAFTDINGKTISLDCQCHSGFCREFTVSSPKVSMGKVMVFTSSVWLVAYAVFFFTEVRQIHVVAVHWVGPAMCNFSPELGCEVD